jgi:hypothetical protein
MKHPDWVQEADLGKRDGYASAYRNIATPHALILLTIYTHPGDVYSEVSVTIGDTLDVDCRPFCISRQVQVDGLAPNIEQLKECAMEFLRELGEEWIFAGSEDE